MRSKPIEHSDEYLYENTFTYLSKEKQLIIFEIPTLLTYADFYQQYPEFLI